MSIKAAIEALDGAAPGPWQWIEYGDGGIECSYMADKDGEDLYRGDDARRAATMKVSIAAPQMAALIKRMVPWVVKHRKALNDIRRRANTLESVGELNEDIAELDAILKEAGE